MSRAIGDTVGAVVGVISDPDLQYVLRLAYSLLRITTTSPEHEFVIIATDGVWEFITSQEAVDFVCRKRKEDVQKSAGNAAAELTS